MIPLSDIVAWSAISDAYGSATEIPQRIRELESLPLHDSYEAEPYYSLWSALCHQRDVFAASYAAVPHLIRIVESNLRNPKAFDVLLLVVGIEAGRLCGNGPEVPSDLRYSYDRAMNAIPSVVLNIAKRSGTIGETRIVSAAVAAYCGHGELALAIIDPPDRSCPQTWCMRKPAA